MVKSYHPIGKPAVPSHVVKKKKGTATTRKSYSPLKSAAQTRKPVVVAQKYEPVSQSVAYFETKYQNGGVMPEVRDEVAAKVVSRSP